VLTPAIAACVAAQDLAGRVAAVVDGGACGCGVESTVLDGLRSPPVVLRPGGVTAELLGLCPDMQGLQVRWGSSSSSSGGSSSSSSSGGSSSMGSCIQPMSLPPASGWSGVLCMSLVESVGVQQDAKHSGAGHDQDKITISARQLVSIALGTLCLYSLVMVQTICRPQPATAAALGPSTHVCLSLLPAPQRCTSVTSQTSSWRPHPPPPG
jgi:hypothetical protein